MTNDAPWFFVRALPPEGTKLSLDPREAHHAMASRRLLVGQFVVIFDGRGGSAPAELVTVGRKAVEVSAGAHRTAPPSEPEVHLGVAPPKGDRLATLLGMVTQLGVASFTTLDCERAVLRARGEIPERWSRIVVEAAKQSRNPRPPKIEVGHSPVDFARSWGQRGASVLLLHPVTDGSCGLGDVVVRTPPTVARALIVGPEGGFTEAEVAACEAVGARRIGLGDGVLRIETAAVAAVALARLVHSGWPAGAGTRDTRLCSNE